ncbi:MAG: hypothetical protein V3W19_18060, partial [Desulfatiglandales bacterium]
MKIRQEGLWGSLSEGRNIYPPEAGKILQSLSNAPWALFRGQEQAEKATVSAETPFWGWPWMNFRADLPFGSELKAEGPFNEM